MVMTKAFSRTTKSMESIGPSSLIFYYDYYVYQYSTGLIASTALAEDVINKKDGAVEK